MLFRLFFPGVVFHELSHYIACLAVGVKVQSVKLFGASEAFVEHGPAGAVYPVGEFAKLAVRARGWSAGRPGLGPGVEFCLLELDVLEHVDDDRAGSAGLGEFEGEGDDLEQILGAAHEEVVLGDGESQAVGVDFPRRRCRSLPWGPGR